MPPLQDFGKISIKTPNGMFELTEVRSIEYIEGDGELTIFYLDNKSKIKGTQPVGFYVKHLNRHLLLFVKANAVTYVNFPLIKTYVNEEIKLISGTNISTSRRCGEQIVRRLKQKEIGYLVVENESAEKQTFDLDTGVQVIGRESRSKPCDIMIETQSTYLSRNHFSIEVTKGNRENYKIIAEIMPDVNPTFVDGVQMKAATKYDLKNNTIITIGPIKIKIKIANADEENEKTLLVKK